LNHRKNFKKIRKLFFWKISDKLLRKNIIIDYINDNDFRRSKRTNLSYLRRKLILYLIKSKKEKNIYKNTNWNKIGPFKLFKK
jgi:hypothetical protein